MKLVRSFPVDIPAGRGYVVDEIPKFWMGGPDREFDYRRLVELGDDVVLIEWDIAVGHEQLVSFMDRAAAEPDRVRVAPYLLYRTRHQAPFYCHRVMRRGSVKTWVTGPEDTHCQMFGFGLVYLPQSLIEGFVAQMDPASHFGDSEFSRWHMRNAPHRDVPIDWDLHAVHLHYQPPEPPEVLHGSVA